jgi:hypothetical protein
VCGPRKERPHDRGNALAGFPDRRHTLQGRCPLCPLSSPRQPDTVNDTSGFFGFHSPPRPVRSRRISLRTWLKLEYRIHAPSPEQGAPEPISEPPYAAATLGALACRYGPGDRVSLTEAAAVAGITTAAASAVRRWARSVDRWPYRESLGFGGQARVVRRRQGGG